MFDLLFVFEVCVVDGRMKLMAGSEHFIWTSPWSLEALDVFAGSREWCERVLSSVFAVKSSFTAVAHRHQSVLLAIADQKSMLRFPSPYLSLTMGMSEAGGAVRSILPFAWMSLHGSLELARPMQLLEGKHMPLKLSGVGEVND
jgi:hypothetical protein